MSPEERKTLKVKVSTWQKLQHLKLKWEVKTVNDVITILLDTKINSKDFTFTLEDYKSSERDDSEN